MDRDQYGLNPAMALAAAQPVDRPFAKRPILCSARKQSHDDLGQNRLVANDQNSLLTLWPSQETDQVIRRFFWK